jgi:hypothetical protein
MLAAWDSRSRGTSPGATILRVAESATSARQLSSAIAAALDDICEDLDRYRARRERHLRLALGIAAADRLIDELEGLALSGCASVPVDWQPRLDGFVGGLPAGVADGLRSGTDPCRLLEEVFAIEERLFRLKLGEWARAFVPEDR